MIWNLAGELSHRDYKFSRLGSHRSLSPTDRAAQRFDHLEDCWQRDGDAVNDDTWGIEGKLEGSQLQYTEYNTVSPPGGRSRYWTITHTSDVVINTTRWKADYWTLIPLNPLNIWFHLRWITSLPWQLNTFFYCGRQHTSSCDRQRRGAADHQVGRRTSCLQTMAFSSWHVTQHAFWKTTVWEKSVWKIERSCRKLHFLPGHVRRSRGWTLTGAMKSH